jgi:hypothetical protein
VNERKPDRTDLSDEQWALIEPVIAAWKAAHPRRSLLPDSQYKSVACRTPGRRA